MFYLSAQTSIIRDGPNRDDYLKKRGEGCKHVQAVIALARRRTSVLWTLLRDDRAFTLAPPITQPANSTQGHKASSVAEAGGAAARHTRT